MFSCFNMARSYACLQTVESEPEGNEAENETEAVRERKNTGKANRWDPEPSRKAKFSAELQLNEVEERIFSFYFYTLVSV